MNITTFKELLTFCESNDLKPPSKCPDELQVDTQVIVGNVTHNNTQAMSVQEKSPPINNVGANVVTIPSKDDKSIPVSQNLADHGVYVDSNEALKGTPRKPRKKPPSSREKNAKKS